MEIFFKSNKLQKNIEDGARLQKTYGMQQALKITQRISELKSAETLSDISFLPPARLHPLKGQEKGKLAIDVLQPFRIVLEPFDGEINNYKSITKIKIIAIKDYH